MIPLDMIYAEIVKEHTFAVKAESAKGEEHNGRLPSQRAACALTHGNVCRPDIDERIPRYK